MTAAVCLQGGAEFGPRCRAMDTRVLERAGGGPVVVVPLAAPSGPEYDVAGANGVRHYRSLRAAEVRLAPDARVDPAGAREACRDARLLVLPGGSPSRLLAALTTTPMAAAVRSVLAAGGVVSGASAGAMVLCSWTLLPDREEVVAGLDVVPRTAVVPHWSGDLRWVESLVAAARQVTVLALPEQSGVLVADGAVAGLGADPCLLIGPGGERDLPVGATVSWPPPG